VRAWFVLLLTLFCSALCNGQTQWRWVKVTNNTINGYSLDEGVAEVAMKGDQFTAKLFSKGPDNHLKILLEGTIKAKRISAKETIQESDYTGSTYHGTFRKKKWEEFSGTVGAESIMLSDGWGMIGITRDIPK
jgi:hypothetical protein